MRALTIYGRHRLLSPEPALRLLLALSAFICVHLRLKILACGLPRTQALAASQAEKKFLPQMNADERGWLWNEPLN
jgi:hypothetical protein